MKGKNEKRTTRLRRAVKLLVLVALFLGVLSGIALFAVNHHMISSVKDRLLTSEQAAQLTDVDCILVLGYRVDGEGNPSPMLRDRVLRGVELYRLGISEILFFTGDSRHESYDEAGAMASLAKENGVLDERIVTDPYGLSTYDSIVRAAELYGFERVVIVTQEYHLYRALYLAKEMGLDAYGVASDLNTYGGQEWRDLRELLARVKDYLYCIMTPEPTMGFELPSER